MVDDKPVPRRLVRGRSGGRLLLRMGFGAVALVMMLLVLASPALAPTFDFPDVPLDYPYRAAITEVAGGDIIAGFPDGTFGPETNVSRQQFAKMIVLTVGLPVSEADVCPFSDVEQGGPGDLYPDHYVAVAATHDITVGTSPGLFSPGNNITRAQVVTMVVRAAQNTAPTALAAPPLGYQGMLDGFDPAHAGTMQIAEFNGLLAGLQGFGPAWDPFQFATRGEVAQVLYNLLQIGDGNSFFGSLLGKVVSGLVSGAASNVGNDAMGEILSLLGWGSNNSGNTAALQAMNAKLDQIEAQLTQIQAELLGLEAALKITEEEILLNTNDPTAAITEIGTYMDELQGMATGVSPGGGNQTKILAYATQVEDDFRIENDVNTIHDAIIPPDSAKAPVLDNFTDLAINQMSQPNPPDLQTAYLGLEQYFTQLIYNQLRGVDLVVEAKQAEAAAGQPDGTSASVYLADFRTNKLAPEVQNFLDNMWRLILSQADLDHTQGFLPAEAEAIVSRAEFLRTQILNMDHFGLRAHVVVTDDWVGKIDPVMAHGNGRDWTAVTETSSAVQGPTYDVWSGSTVKSSTNYTIVTYDFGPAIAGTYTITGPNYNGLALGTTVVQNYDDDYTPDAAGTDVYGSSVGSTRTGGVEGFAKNAATGTWVKPGTWNVSCTGTIAQSFIGVQGSNSNDDFGGTNEANYGFVYGGSQPVTMSIPVGANPIGSESVGCNADAGGSAQASMGYSVGVWDSTAGTDAVGRVTGSRAVYTNDKATTNTTINQTFTFTAQPGHSYYVFFAASVSGSSQYGSAAAKMVIGCGGGLEVRFPN
jgi:hypothetical protein